MARHLVRAPRDAAGAADAAAAAPPELPSGRVKSGRVFLEPPNLLPTSFPASQAAPHRALCSRPPRVNALCAPNRGPASIGAAGSIIRGARAGGAAFGENALVRFVRRRSRFTALRAHAGCLEMGINSFSRALLFWQPAAR